MGIRTAASASAETRKRKGSSSSSSSSNGRELSASSTLFLAMEDLQPSMTVSFSSTTGILTVISGLPVDSELWSAAEERTQEVLCAIQPVVASEKKREAIIKYVIDLVKEHFGVEVLTFGSVPLKTYLPDGDIDLTAFIHPNLEEKFAMDICRILKREEERGFQVKNVNYIEAQVKVVKCCVKNICVDISFNQMAGLTALYFLEQVDQFIGKDHFLKRSIILIKAWCYYESRILGAHHGLLSTYALEILVLHIINLFHASSPGPLAVLYRFLDYYSKFDWETYGVSIFGRVPLSSLPKLTESIEEKGLLFGHELLRRNRGSSSASEIYAENGTDEFLVKYLNIVDPLKDGNNLGRSVGIGNFHRIKRAFSAGAQQFAEILELPGEIMVARLEKFFENTLELNGKGLRPDAEVPVPPFGSERSVHLCADYNSHVSFIQHLPPLPPHQFQPEPFLLSPLPMIASEAMLSSHSEKNFCPQNNLAVFAPPVQPDGGAYVQNGINRFVPVVPVFQPYPHQLYVGFLPRSLGTGTYIPTLAAYMYGDYRQRSRTRAPFPRTRRQRQRSPRIEAIDVPPEEQESENGISVGEPGNEEARETEKSELGGETGGEGYIFDLSSEQFPLLPTINKSISSEAHIRNANGTITAEGIKFGTLPSPILLQPGNLKDATASPDVGEHQTGIDATGEFELSHEEFPPLYTPPKGQAVI